MEKYITLTRTIKAPVEKVWQAWTNEKKVQAWWAPEGFTCPVCTVDAKVGGELYIVMQAGKNMGEWSNMKAPMKGIFSEVVENKKLVFSNVAIDEAGNHLLEGTTIVTFEANGDKTKLTVHTGAKGVVQQAEQMLAGMEAGWNQQIDKLEEVFNAA